MKKLFISVFTVTLLAAGCAQIEDTREEADAPPAFVYPFTERLEHHDDYHGTAVADPYRWLEQTDSPATRDWIAAQNSLSVPYLRTLSDREAIKNDLTRFWNYERRGTPFRYGDRYFHFRNDGLQDQSVLYVSNRIGGVERPILNPNEFSPDGTVSLSRVQISPRARYVAYALSDGGSDWVKYRIRDVSTGQDLEDVIRGVKFSNVAWLPDETGFYYSRYPDTAAGEPDDSRPVSIYFHRLGTAQSSDRRIYDLSRHSSTRNPYPTVSADGRFLIATISDGFEANAVHYLDLTNRGARWQPIFDDWDALYSLIDTDANLMFFHTTHNAPTGRVIAVDINRPQSQHWEEIIAPRDQTLTDVSYIGGRFFATYLDDAHSRVDIYNAYGRHLRQLELPGIGTVTGFTGNKNHLETFFGYTSFTEPGAIYRYDIANNELDLHHQTQLPVPLDSYVTEQVFYNSKDGTQIPMFVLRHRDTPINGSAPTLLYGYGGFNISLTPSFNVSHIAWLANGGILAIPNIRGGGEYGREWHLAGTGANKQNVFDDFIAAAEYLVEENYTTPERLAIYGRSNGGLLVAAVMTQRPELFAAVLPEVGVLDMLRYHTPSANARAWSSDFGISTNEQDFRTLRAYSPLHNVEPGVCYPATLITTGDHDDRVAPWHSYKFAATLQHAQNCDNPILLRVETRAGHGAGSPTWMRIEQIADQWAFLREHMRSASALQNESE